MRQIAFREALREAMSEEMRKDDKVFLMGEEVAEYNGAYKVSQGMLAEFGPHACDACLTESRFKGPPKEGSAIHRVRLVLHAREDPG